MRKLFLIVVGMLFMFTACQKEEIVSPDSGRGQTITVNIPQTGVATRAAGDGTQINRCILEIYRNGALYGERHVVAVSGKTATFNDLRLVSNQTYDFVFWADCATEGTDGALADKHYNTENLAAITVSNYAGNNDEFDAFFHCEKDYKVTQAFNLAVNLKRPFGQLNVTTTDWNQIPDADLKPTDVKVEFVSLANTFNALTGVASGDVSVSYEAAVADVATGALTVDYIFASEDEGATLVDYTMTFLNEGTEISKNDAFTNIPVRRNYKTNVKGNLLTKGGEFNVTIDPTFNTPDINEELGETAKVATVTDVEEAIRNGAREIIVESAPTAAATIEIPHTLTEEQAAEKVTITVPATDKDITIQYTTELTGKATKEIELFVETTGTLVLDLPESTVTLRGSVGSLEANTAANTLIVPEGITVGNLIVNGGNVEIYGDVNAIEFKNEKSLISVYSVKTVDKLKEAVAFVESGRCAKIVLGADLDLAGSKENPWKPIDTEGKKFVEFDGAGHTISNLYVDNYTGKADGKGNYYGGFFYVLQGNVKNLTIETADITCFRGGVLVGRMDYGTVEKCRVVNATVKSIQKVAGLVGFVSANSKDVVIKGSSVEGLSVSTLLTNDGLYQAGGLIGFLSVSERNVLIEGNSVSNIKFGKVSDGTVDAPFYDNDLVFVLEQNYSHAFIGTISNVSKDDVYDQYKVELKGNSVAQQIEGIPTCDRTDDYIGWWAGEYNASGYDHASKVIVDGVEKDRWIEVKRIYGLLQAGGEILIRRNYDLTKCDDTKGDVVIDKPTTLNISEKATLTVGQAQITNQNELTMSGKGTLTGKSNLIYNESRGKVTINSGNFKATATGDAAIVFNMGDVVINGGTLETNGHFAIQNNYGKSVTINGGTITAKGAGDYCILMHGSGALTVTGGTLTGNFGCVRLHGGTSADISGGEFIATGRFYALYVGGSTGTGAVANVSGGKFCSASTSAQNTCIYVDKNNTLNLTGGEFQNKGHDANVAGSIVPQNGYVFTDNADANYPFKVVAQN